MPSAVFARAAAVDHVVRVNGLRLRYRQLGNPKAPPVLIVHGIMGHSWE